MRKKQFFQPNASGAEDEDDEEPLMKEWIQRKTTVPTESMAKIKLEK